MKWVSAIAAIIITALLITSCKKETERDEYYTYYEVGFDVENENWRDTLVIVRTSNTQLIEQADAQLNLPVEDRKIIFGEITSGSGGFNKNATHVFNWHYKDNWELVDVTAEIYDGRPYSDVELNSVYWLNQMKRFGSWGSYIKRKLP